MVCFHPISTAEVYGTGYPWRIAAGASTRLSARAHRGRPITAVIMLVLGRGDDRDILYLRQHQG